MTVEKEKEEKGVDARAVFAVFALILTIGTGAFYHLEGRILSKDAELWTEKQMKEYKDHMDERYRLLLERVTRLERGCKPQGEGKE